MTTTIPTNKKGLPRGWKLPGFILSMQSLIDQFGLLDKTQEKYGDFVYTPKSLGFPPYVILSNPQAIEEVLTANPKIFEVGSGHDCKRPENGTFVFQVHITVFQVHITNFKSFKNILYLFDNLK